jgi:hypothetical protein
MCRLEGSSHLQKREGWNAPSLYKMYQTVRVDAEVITMTTAGPLTSTITRKIAV